MSRVYYSSAPVIHYREHSNDSRASYSSTSSTEKSYASRPSMANGGHYSGTPSYVREETREHRYRTADDERKYVSSKTSHSGRVEVIDQRQVIYDRDAPRSGDASSKHYKDTSERKHKHKSHKH